MDQTYFGRICPHCKQPLTPRDIIAVCGVCHVPQHLSCWQKNEGCTTPGCHGRIEQILNNPPVVTMPTPAAAPRPVQPPVAAASTEPPIIVLSESKKSVFLKDIPLVMEETVLKHNRINDTVFATCTFRSLTDRPIKAILIEISCKDTWGNTLSEPILFQYIDLATQRDSLFGQNTPIVLPDASARSFQVSVKKVLFADETLLDGNGVACIMDAPVSLSQQLERNELVIQYKRETTQNAQFVPVCSQDYWRCTCGGINTGAEETCHLCGTAMAVMVDSLNPEALQANLAHFLAQMQAADEKAKAEQAERLRQAQEKARLEQERLQQEMQQRQEEAQRLYQEQEQARIALMAQKKKKRKKALIITAIIAVPVLTALILGAIFFGIPYLNYRNACDALENGYYEDAYQGFVDLDGFMDSDELAKKALYQQAVADLEDQDFDSAYELFVQLGDYEDSADKAKEALYQKAIYLFQTGKYDAAHEIFVSLGKYVYSEDMAKECLYQKATKLLAEEQFDAARDLFLSLGKYSDSDYMATECLYQKGMDYLFGAGNWDAAMKIFTQIVNNYESHASNSKEMLKECQYQQACALLEVGEYKQAVSLFVELDRYNDSISKANEARYSYVLTHKNNDDKTTYEYLKALKTARYSNADSIYKELYDWKITVLGWNSDPNSTTYKTSISKYNPVYCHFKLTGGTPGETTVIHITGSLPNGNSIDYTFSYATEDGWVGWFGWSDGIYNNPQYGTTGSIYLTFYDRYGIKIGTASVRISS